MIFGSGIPLPDYSTIDSLVYLNTPTNPTTTHEYFKNKRKLLFYIYLRRLVFKQMFSSKTSRKNPHLGKKQQKN